MDFELEQRFLAWCLIDPGALRLVTAEVFWLPENRLFFQAIQDVERRGGLATAESVAADLRAQRRLADAGGEARIRQMFEQVEPHPDAARVASALGRLHRLRTARTAAFGAAAAIGQGRHAEAAALLREAAQAMRAA